MCHIATCFALERDEYMQTTYEALGDALGIESQPQPAARIVEAFTVKFAYLYHELDRLGNTQAVRSALKSFVKAGMLVRDGQYYRTMAIHANELREGITEVRQALNNKGYTTGYRTLSKMIEEDVPAKGAVFVEESKS